MTADASPISFGSWNPAGSVFPIKYSIPLLHEIDFFVADGYRRIPHGGLEVGGLLYGRVEAEGLTLLAYQPIECQHLLGPSFILSDADLDALRVQVARPFSHQDHGELTLAGWFISHSRSELKLSDREVEIFDDLFPSPRQVTLLIKPEKFKPTRYGFLVRPRRSRLTDPECHDSFILPLTPRQGDQSSGAVSSAVRSRSLARLIKEVAAPPPDSEKPADAAMKVETPAAPEEPPMALNAQSLPEAADTVPAPVDESPIVLPARPLPIKIIRLGQASASNEEPVATEPHPEPVASRAIAPKAETKLVLTPAGDDDFVPFAGRRGASGESRNTPRWLEIGVGATLIVASIAAVLWTYLNFLLPAIPLRADLRGGTTVLTWPPEMTNGAEASLIVWTGDQKSERELSSEEQKSGSAVLPNPAADSTVQLRIYNWAYARSGQIRLIQVPPAPVPPVIKPNQRRRRVEVGDASSLPTLEPDSKPAETAGTPSQAQQPPRR